MRRYAYLMIMAGMMTLGWSCKPLDLAPENTYTDLTYWSTEANALSMLNTAYSQISNSDYFFSNEALSDNAFNGRGDFNGAASLAAGTYDPSLGRLNNEWNFHYQGIKTCNLILQHVDQVPMDDTLKERVKAEARFIRALKHFQLMTWFGDIPLLERDPSIEEAMAIQRTPKSDVLAFILQELEAVAQILPASYSGDNTGRITSGGALALKARVYLYEGQWQDVVTTTERLINGTEYGNYALFPSYSGLFMPANQNNEEVIFDLQYVPNFRTWNTMFDMAPLSAGARVNMLAPTQELVDSYVMLNGLPIADPNSGYREENPYLDRDPRLTHTVVYHLYEWANPDGSTHTIYTEPGSSPNNSLDEYAAGAASSPTGYYTRKYFDPTHAASFASGLNLILIRYADVLLMYAEAKNELGMLSQDDWEQTIRPIRERAGFEVAQALAYPSDWSQADFREAIRNERRSEFAMEGTRIFDIRRWRIAEDVLDGWAHGARYGPVSEDRGYIRVNQRTFDPNKHYLWPIPREERNLNENLTQNPGWEN